jgi:hypothetical protein
MPSPWPALALILGTGLAAPAMAAGLGVVRDAETGQLRSPTAAEAQAFEQAKAALAAPPAARRAATKAAVGGIETRHANGAVSRTLEDSDLLLSTATRSADGQLSLRCLPAAQARQQTASQAAPAEPHDASGGRHDR